MQRKVKFFDKLYDTDTLDEEINAWIENYDKKLIDVKLTVDREEEIDDLINGFLEENQNIEIIDIKYQSNISAVADSGISATYFNNSALIIYKENAK